MIFTPGWENPKISLPLIGKDVLICVPDNSTKPFYIAKIVEVRGKESWCANNSVCSLFFPLEKVSRWMPIPLFGGFGYNKEETRMMPIDSAYRFELIDFEE